MKAGEMSDEQIVAILQEADKGEKKLADLCREKGISQNTFYTWKRKFQGMQTNEVKRLRELEKENVILTFVWTVFGLRDCSIFSPDRQGVLRYRKG